MLAVSLGGVAIASFLLYSVWRLVYNMYLHPLARFPGPWWAGATTYAEAYFDIIKGGRYFSKIEAMHARYGKLSTSRDGGLLTTAGPIVRIGPTELSIRDAEFYEHIYGNMSKSFQQHYAMSDLAMNGPSLEILW